MEIFQNLSLMHFSMTFPTFNEASWRSLLQEIPKCPTLISLEFRHIAWCGSEYHFNMPEIVVQLAQFLKNNPNILATNTMLYFYDHNDGLYERHIAPILEHHHLTKNLKILKERESYQVRGFLVAEAVGTRFPTKVSICYIILQANMDVLVSYLLSRPLSRGKKRTLCSLPN